MFGPLVLTRVDRFLIGKMEGDEEGEAVGNSGRKGGGLGGGVRFH